MSAKTAMEKAMETPAMRQYLETKKQYPDAILFFRMGDFYEMFFEDAVVASEILGITLTCRHKDAEIPLAGVPWHAADFYIGKLLEAGKKVAVCEQNESFDNSKISHGQAPFTTSHIQHGTVIIARFHTTEHSPCSC